MKNLFLKIRYLFFFILLCGLIFFSFTNKKENNLIFNVITENSFLNKEEIFDLTKDMINDSLFIDLNNLEKKIKSNKFIKEIEIYNNLNNVININVNQFKPFARLILEIFFSFLINTLKEFY